MPETLVVRNRSFNRNNNGRPRLRQGQVRRIVALIISLVILLYLNDTRETMSAANAVKFRNGAFSVFLSFRNIVKTTFAGYENYIEAGASSIAAVLYRKFQTGTLRPNVANLAIGSAAFAMSLHRNVHAANFLNNLNKYNNSRLARLSRAVGFSRGINAEKVRTAIISMIAWLISGLRYFSAENVAGIVREELRVRGLERSTPARLINYGSAALRLTY